MALKFINSGTASVEAGGRTVTGQDTAWALQVSPGDLFGGHVGRQVRVESVESNTSLTLAWDWPGETQTAAAYEIQVVADTSRYQETTRSLLQSLADGALSAIQDAGSAADTLPYYTDEDAAALTSLTAAGRALLALTTITDGGKALLGLAGAADTLPYYTDEDALALAALTSTGRSVIGAADAAALRDITGAAAKAEIASWTPTFGAVGSGAVDGVHTYGQQMGISLKIDRFVLVMWYVLLSAKDPAMTGQFAVVRGLPYASHSVSNSRWSGVASNAGNWTGFSSNIIGVMMQNGVTFVYPSRLQDTNNPILTPANLTNSSFIGGSLAYISAS